MRLILLFFGVFLTGIALGQESATNASRIWKGDVRVELMSDLILPIGGTINRPYDNGTYVGNMTLKRKTSIAPWLRISYLSKNLLKETNRNVLRINLGNRVMLRSYQREVNYVGEVSEVIYDWFGPQFEEGSFKENAWSAAYVMELGLKYELNPKNVSIELGVNGYLGINVGYWGLFEGVRNQEPFEGKSTFFPRYFSTITTAPAIRSQMVYGATFDLAIRPRRLSGVYFLLNLPVWSNYFTDRSKPKANLVCPCGNFESPAYSIGLGIGYSVNYRNHD